MRYLIRTSNYLERIVLYNPSHIISMTDLIAIGVDIPREYSGFYLE